MTDLPRQVEPEQLDSLPADDPAAIRSRRDLQRLNVLMGQPGSVAGLLESHGAAAWMRRLVDLGGGDGTLLLRVARRLAPRCRGVRAVVVDRQARVSAGTRAGFATLGWEIEAVVADVFEWLERDPARAGTVVIANLFVHHFREAALRELLARIASRTDLFVACEPRRSRFTLAASRRVGWIGCNAVTRNDATISVRAGFSGRELSALWPEGGDWHTDEGSIGPFSHYFVARRRGA